MTSKPSLELPSLDALSHNHPLLTQPTFDPDVLLQSRSHVPLEELRGELRAYLTILREELVQLINEDYEEFIALGVGLRGEVQRLKRLEEPLFELHNEVDLVNGSLESHELRLNASLGRRSELRDESNLLEAMHKLFEAVSRTEGLIEGDILRIGNEYSQIKYLLKKLEAEGCSVVDVLEPRLRIIRQRIEGRLAVVLVEAMSSADMSECLKVYDIIDGWDQVRERVATIVDGLCEQPGVFTQTPGHKHSPLAAMYNRLLDELQAMSMLFDAAEQVSPRFAFVESVVVPCITKAIRINLGRVIFSAGRPDELHENYTTTSRFLTALEALAPSPSAISNIRESADIALLHRQWQLPVYFQLRWKDIVTRLEKSLENPPSIADWLIPQSGAVLEAVETCWSEDVFIKDLEDRFWRLTLQAVDDDLRWAVKAVVDLKRLASRVPISADDLLSPAEFQNTISAILIDRCAEQLKPVRAVASQLRTSTGPSSTHSPYIQAVFRPLQTILTDFPTYPAPSQTVVKEVFAQFDAMLVSVRKTEDLLRRHRKSRKTGFTLFSSGDTEEGRFDEQMRVDIARLGKEASGLGVDVEELDEWRELCGVMDRAVEA